MGISEYVKLKFFKVFVQVDVFIFREYGGIGFGFVICKCLVELMGGDLILESEVDKGSCFFFVLFVCFDEDFGIGF